ncbi:MAG: 2-C-methyl-D-erythritol 2,4-cyclodiphosphate synthase [Gammaproteobacteria bacterium]|jgi:2-C-methyl-D-erythritol 2,4-cyclodiphosphate synthase|nr:MAG: 2-C-methyl-D-erythritol 2,4-cyclodiphosphate synthase [Gammaproteobacteria bacterium SG8_31]
MRIGNGFDVHAFDEGDFITLGGVRIPYHRGLRAHSDGDVVLHALCDALLGAIGEGDIGVHFPDSDPRWSGADSRMFLRHVTGMVHGRGFDVANADLTVVAQSPRLRPFMDEMRANVAADLQVDRSQVNLKATTTEGLGFAGRSEGVAAFAVVLLLAR